MGELLRLYAAPRDPFDRDGYPIAWREIKHLVRAMAGHRCVRCGHPYLCGQSAPEWSACDEHCTHAGPVRLITSGPVRPRYESPTRAREAALAAGVADPPLEAQWRVLTVHHLTGEKADCRWWNLAALCQRCHLEIQGRVVMERVYAHEHSDWFKPYAAGWYAWRYLNENVNRPHVENRLEELLALEVRQLELTCAGS